jgi:hypothetical protein
MATYNANWNITLQPDATPLMINSRGVFLSLEKQTDNIVPGQTVSLPHYAFVTSFTLNMPLVPFSSDAGSIPVVPSATGIAGTADTGKLLCHLPPRVDFRLHRHQERVSLLCRLLFCFLSAQPC